jgi:hypothetical protein
VALQITSNSSLPEVDYLVLLDKLYILPYAFVVLTLAVIVRNSWVDAAGDVSTAARADPARARPADRRLFHSGRVDSRLLPDVTDTAFRRISC